MGVARIGRTRSRPGCLDSDAYRRLQIPQQASRRTATIGHKAVGLILVAIIAVGYVIGWMRTFLFAP